MNIEMIDGQCTVTWERVPKPVHDEIVERLKKAGAAFDKPRSCWTLPTNQADRLFAAFPKASYAYDVICSIVEAQERRIAIFGRNLLALGIRLIVSNGRVVAQGTGATETLQSAIDERGDNLRVWLQAQNTIHGASRGLGSTVGAIPVQPITNDSARSDSDYHNAELLAKSLRNAAKNQDREDAMRTRRGRAKVKA